jgi:hypothetical protein
MANGDRFYMTPLRRSAVFACADTYTIRHPEHHIEWQVFDQNESALTLWQWKDPDVLSSLHLLNVSYLAPSHFASQYSNIATHFNAPQRIRTSASSPLAENQWKHEAKKMFNTELALQQFHVLGIAQGAGSSLPQARNLLEDFGVDARAKILFPASGWKNIKVAELMGFMCACLICWMITIEGEDGDKEKVLLVKVVGRSVWVSCMYVVQVIGRRLHEAWKALQDVNFELIYAWIEGKRGLIGL